MKDFSPLKNWEPVVSILSQISIFGGTTDHQQHEIFRRLETAWVEPGEYVFRKGDEPTHIYLVKRGSIELLLPDDDTFIEKKKLGVGECFGQVALMSMQRHTIEAMAIEETELIVLSRRALIELRHADIELFALLMMNIARELARRLTFTDDLLVRTLHAHA
jgi:CRP/FNR family transcriptional regulator, cyclic AMP receptor protein